MKTLNYLLLTFFISLNSWAVPFRSSQIMITGESKVANEIGLRIAEKGGNVADVAVAVGLAMMVTNPSNASLGGGGFAMVHFNRKVRALDFREVAPEKSHKDFFVNDDDKNSSITGGKAIAVPGFAAGLYALHKKYGKLPWRKLFPEVLAIAKNGFRVSGTWVDKTNRNINRFNASGKKYFLKKGKTAFKPGEVLKQAQLHKALRLFRNLELSGFYHGPVAKDIVESTQKAGGVLTMQDLKSYKVRWLKPIKTIFRDHAVYLMPPPSSGGVVIKTALSLIDKLNIEQYPPLSVNELHLLGEIQNRSFRGRALLGDPDFYKNPIEKITSNSYITQMANSIRIAKASKIEPLKETIPQKESTETTHYTVMDNKGNAIALTVTLNGVYGSGVVSNKYGISLNNEMDDFTTRPGEANMFGLMQGEGNAVTPGKRPLSSMSPTIIRKGRKFVMALGAPGGPKIISGVLQTIYRKIINGYDIDAAIETPRIHNQFLPHTLYVNKSKFSPEILDGLRQKGHQVEESFWSSRVNGIVLRNRILHGEFDSRAEGSVTGY